MEKLRLPILIFDSECGLCLRFKQALEKLDKNDQITFFNVHDDLVYEHYPQLDKKECLKEIHLIDEDLRVYRAAEVIEFLAKMLPATRRIAWLLDSNAGQKAADFFYKKVNDFKHSKHNKCHSCKK